MKTVPAALRASGTVAVVLISALLAGCQNDEPIRERQEQPAEFETRYVDPPHTERMMIIGAIAPAGNGSQWWFFKLAGPAAEVRKQQQNFEAFLDSLHYDPKSELEWQWKEPPGWRELAGRGERYASFQIGPNLDAVSPVFAFAAGAPIVAAAYPLVFPEMTVTLLGGDLPVNVNRWREQVGLPALSRADVNRSMQLREVKGSAVFVVDMAGPSWNAPKRPAFAAAHGH
jgi:hypothetical protein